MAYTKQNWVTGETITAEKLNHMEDGIAGGGVFVVHVNEIDGNLTMDKTWQEINNALKTGLVLIRYIEGEVFVVLEFVAVTYIDATYWVESIGIDGGMDSSVYVGKFSTDSPSGYPLKIFSEG